ncbi:hypothetical protein BGZ93_005049 [Podila epicladia]|nr:hypothetical protein BGZ92_003822 [Podila epicladia]KAG0099964.1 hypothetical protein BGZ93_005049 [Podila epicladia]
MLRKDDKDIGPRDPSGVNIKLSQHLIKDTKPSTEVADPADDTKETQKIPDSKDATPGSNSTTTNLHPKRKVDSDIPENDVVDPPSDDSFKTRKKNKQWKRKQRKLEKMHQWKQEAGLEKSPT